MSRITAHRGAITRGGKLPLLLVSALLVLVVSCNDEPLTSPKRLPQAKISKPPSYEGPPTDSYFRPRFDVVSVRALDKLTPGSLATLEVQVHAAVPTREARIELFLPDIDAAPLLSKGRRVISVYMPVPARQTWTVAINGGETVRRTARIVVPRAGQYRITVRVTPGVGDGGAYAGHALKQDAYMETWLSVGATAGTITDHFTAAASATAAERAAHSSGGPGPHVPDDLPPVQAQLCAEDDPDCVPVGGGGGTSGTIYGFVAYTNSITAAPQTIARANVAVYGPDYHLITGTVTDAYGHYSLTLPACPPGAGDLLVAFSENADVKVERDESGEPTDFAAYWIYPENCNQQFDIGAYYNSQAEAFDNFTQMIPNSRALFQGEGTRGKITVAINQSITGGGYEIGTDRIVLGSDRLSGWIAAFDDAHEYGHAVMSRALGGIALTSCPSVSNHQLWGVQSSMQCAFVEGFADFHAWSTRNIPANPSSGYYAKDSADFNVFWNSPNETDAARVDGSRIEGAIAALLLDALDGPSSTDRISHGLNGGVQNLSDDFQVTGAYLAKVMRTCTNKQASDPQGSNEVEVQRDAIDHLFNCINKWNSWHKDCPTCIAYFWYNVDEGIRDTYFPLRRASGQYPRHWYDITAQDNDPPYASDAWFARMYAWERITRCNLYGQGCVPSS